MGNRLRELIFAAFERRTKGPTPEERAFNALVGKFSQIQYLVDQKATLDVIEKTPVGICITNKQYIYEYVNPAYCQIYGYQYDELIGNPFTVVVPLEYQEELKQLHDKFMDQEAELEGQWQVVTKAGERRTILANAAYVVDERRTPKKITFVLDITERIAALDALEGERAKQLAMVDRIRSNVLPEIDSIAAGKESPELRNLRAMIEDLIDPES